MADAPGDKKPIDPAKRRRLQQMFEHGSKSSAKGDFKYATEMFTQCVLGDPGNLVYVSNFIGNLQKQYNNNKTGSKMASISGMGIKGSIKKSSMQKDWTGVLTSGLEMLKLNPWDSSACAAMAVACENLEYDDCQLAYLKAAMDANIADPELNRLAGRANGRLGRFDDAIACWVRVSKAKPGDVEAQRAIGDLTVEKTISQGKYEDAKSTKEVRKGAGEDEPAIGLQLTPEQKLEKAIAKDPGNSSLYMQLSDIYISREQFAKAEEVLQKALQASGGETNVRERLEDTQLRRLRGQVEIGKKKATEDKTPESAALYEKLATELNNMEMTVYRSRCDRYPANTGFRYQLGVRLQKAKLYSEAIKAYQEARNDPQKKGEVLLNLGECFHHIKQFELALGNYEQAIAEIKDEELAKLALYRAGKLALGMKLVDKAHKYLTDLAGRDFGYKDVAECLDKIRLLRDKGGSPAE